MKAEIKMKTYQNLNNGCAMNPFLPSTEYIPDGEPHVFGDRVYLFGSHDRFGGNGYCQEPYVAWSAAVEDLNQWKYEGVILEKGQDPLDPKGEKAYFAPDVAQGPDGRFYLYYSLEDSEVISVAVCDIPAGRYKFYGHVKDHQGHIIGSAEEDPSQFDPAVLVDGDRIYLYSGQNIPVSGVDEGRKKGSFVCELEKDMVTVKTPQKVLTSGIHHTFHENPFFEASSIRKFDGRYYFIYSALPNVHNLCFAVSDFPDKDFVYGGVLISNADIDAEDENRKTQNYWGNNHGSIERINGEYYIFYHRHTNQSPWNRQACAEKICMDQNGTFRQAHLTSTGPGKESVDADGVFGFYTACHLFSKNMKEYQPFQFIEYTETDPYFTQDHETEYQYISHFTDGSIAEFRYFYFSGNERKLNVEYRGGDEGVLELYVIQNGEVKKISEAKLERSMSWKVTHTAVTSVEGNATLRFEYKGTGKVDLLTFSFGE